jgi:hypothetical protein
MQTEFWIVIDKAINIVGIFVFFCRPITAENLEVKVSFH